MSVTGIILFVIFLLVKSLLSKKRGGGQREADEAPAARRASMQEAHEKPRPERPEDVRKMQEMLEMLLDERAAQRKERTWQEADTSVGTPSTAVSAPAAPRPAEKRWREPPPAKAEAAHGAKPIDLAPAAMMQAVVLAEVIGRPKALRGRNPYFRR
ncbi:dihydropteroate synthase [uncultured Selenomonas sp.]|uniref:dihydropteroate synthase n=1 Tax=uncultured Selenomonas sp. TaxID=159275 RepID=UPI0028DCA6F0|nr:dihydropteroate synthase [uncultured Selenomonas sp.]